MCGNGFKIISVRACVVTVRIFMLQQSWQMMMTESCAISDEHIIHYGLSFSPTAVCNGLPKHSALSK